jgi:hypothetical protein
MTGDIAGGTICVDEKSGQCPDQIYVLGELGPSADTSSTNTKRTNFIGRFVANRSIPQHGVRLAVADINVSMFKNNTSSIYATFNIQANIPTANRFELGTFKIGETDYIGVRIVSNYYAHVHLQGLLNASTLAETCTTEKPVCVGLRILYESVKETYETIPPTP